MGNKQCSKEDDYQLLCKKVNPSVMGDPKDFNQEELFEFLQIQKYNISNISGAIAIFYKKTENNIANVLTFIEDRIPGKPLIIINPNQPIQVVENTNKEKLYYNINDKLKTNIINEGIDNYMKYSEYFYKRVDLREASEGSPYENIKKLLREELHMKFRIDSEIEYDFLITHQSNRGTNINPVFIIDWDLLEEDKEVKKIYKKLKGYFMPKSLIAENFKENIIPAEIPKEFLRFDKKKGHYKFKSDYHEIKKNCWMTLEEAKQYTIDYIKNVSESPFRDLSRLGPIFLTHYDIITSIIQKKIYN